MLAAELGRAELSKAVAGLDLQLREGSRGGEELLLNCLPNQVSHKGRSQASAQMTLQGENVRVPPRFQLI